MRNIELKARLLDRPGAEQVCRDLGAAPRGDIQQVDTYFRVPEGRLKLRESEPGEDCLVFYRRPDVAAIKGCDYVLCTADQAMKRVLGAALGELAVVEKVRTVYLWHNVRIHLDRVGGLGDFIEFEAVLGGQHDDEDGEAKVSRLQEAFDIAREDLLDTSYLEMVLAMQEASS